MKDMEDYIDFPCSADWLDFYHVQGLTPRHSGRRDKEYVYLARRIEVLERQNKEILEQNKQLLFIIKKLIKTTGQPEDGEKFDSQWLDKKGW